jgi:hypothetical protein
MGAAIATQGPRCILSIIPLDVQDLATCDVWLLSLLRKHTSRAELCFWGEYLLPRAREFRSLFARAQSAGALVPFVLGYCTVCLCRASLLACVVIRALQGPCLLEGISPRPMPSGRAVLLVASSQPGSGCCSPWRASLCPASLALRIVARFVWCGRQPYEMHGFVCDAQQ